MFDENFNPIINLQSVVGLLDILFSKVSEQASRGVLDRRWVFKANKQMVVLKSREIEWYNLEILRCRWGDWSGYMLSSNRLTNEMSQIFDGKYLECGEKFF